MTKKRTTTGRQKGEVYTNLVPIKDRPNMDTLLPALDKPLPRDVSQRIAQLNKEGLPRTKIAKAVGIPKIHVIQELIRIGG